MTFFNKVCTLLFLRSFSQNEKKEWKLFIFITKALAFSYNIF